MSEKEYDDAIHLFYTNIDVNSHNTDITNKLQGQLEEIAANLMHSKGYKPKTKNGQIDMTQFAEILSLKKNSRVMIIANVDIKDSIVNGSLETVIDFVKTVVEDKDGQEKEIVK